MPSLDLPNSWTPSTAELVGHMCSRKIRAMTGEKESAASAMWLKFGTAVRVANVVLATRTKLTARKLGNAIGELHLCATLLEELEQ